jgi:hypothetical protein
VIVETAGRMATPAAGSQPPAATTRRTFAPDERVRALVQVYQGTRRTDGIAPMFVRTSILDSNGNALRDQVMALAAKDFTHRRAALALEIGGLPQGEYVLNLDAALAQHKTARTLRFTVQ